MIGIIIFSVAYILGCSTSVDAFCEAHQGRRQAGAGYMRGGEGDILEPANRIVSDAHACEHLCDSLNDCQQFIYNKKTYGCTLLAKTYPYLWGTDLSYTSGLCTPGRDKDTETQEKYGVSLLRTSKAELKVTNPLKQGHWKLVARESAGKAGIAGFLGVQKGTQKDLDEGRDAFLGSDHYNAKDAIIFWDDSWVKFTAASPIFVDSKDTAIAVHDISTNDVNLKANLGAKPQFCRASSAVNNIHPGDTSWGLISRPLNDSFLACGCSGDSNEGQGLLYGGVDNCDVCGCSGGGISGAVNATDLTSGITDHIMLIYVKDLCAEKNCGDHGGCSATTGQCVCEPGWTGALCAVSPNLCIEDPAPIDCGEHGTCTMMGAQAACNCDEKWRGVTCEIEILPPTCADHCVGVYGACQTTAYDDYTCYPMSNTGVCPAGTMYCPDLAVDPAMTASHSTTDKVNRTAIVAAKVAAAEAKMGHVNIDAKAKILARASRRSKHEKEIEVADLAVDPAMTASHSTTAKVNNAATVAAKVAAAEAKMAHEKVDAKILARASHGSKHNKKLEVASQQASSILSRSTKLHAHVHAKRAGGKKSGGKKSGGKKSGGKKAGAHLASQQRLEENSESISVDIHHRERKAKHDLKRLAKHHNRKHPEIYQQQLKEDAGALTVDAAELNADAVVLKKNAFGWDSANADVSSE